MYFATKNNLVASVALYFSPTRKDALFCSSKCRQEYHTRRKERGAILYDLFMINRNERTIAKQMKAWHVMTRLAMYWRKEDKLERNGRKSWQDAETVRDQTAWARATILN